MGINIEIMSYSNFIRSLIISVIAFVIILSHVSEPFQVGLCILGLAVVVDIFSLLRLKSLGYSYKESLRMLYISAYKFKILLNRIDNKIIH